MIRFYLELVSGPLDFLNHDILGDRWDGMGFLVGETHQRRETIESVDEFAVRQQQKQRQDDEKVCEAVRVAVRRYANRLLGKKPVTQVHLVRL